MLQHFQQGLGVHANLLPVKRLVQHNKQVYTLNYDGRSAMAVARASRPMSGESVNGCTASCRA